MSSTIYSLSDVFKRGQYVLDNAPPDPRTVNLADPSSYVVGPDGLVVYRHVLAIGGGPGAGKTTLAKALVRYLNSVNRGKPVAYFPMDGFHFENPLLEEMGRRQRKGAPDTFDAAGYWQALNNFRTGGPETMFAPDFDRGRESTVANGIVIPDRIQVIVTEGNYLLLKNTNGWETEAAAWPNGAPFCDETWMVDVDPTEELHRLVRRQVAGGKSPQAAFDWASGSDMTNAEFIRRNSRTPDFVIKLDRDLNIDQMTDAALGHSLI